MHDQITGFTLDGAWKVNQGPFERLSFGVGTTDRTKSRIDSSNDWTNGSGQYGTLYQTAGCPVQCSPYSFGSQGFNVVSMVTLPNFMQGAGGSYPTTLPVLNATQLIILKSLNGKANPFYCLSTPCLPPYTPFNYALTEPQINPYNSYSVTEKHGLALYMQGADFLDACLSAEFSACAWCAPRPAPICAVAVPVSLWTPSTNPSTVQTWNVQYGTSQPLGADGSRHGSLPAPTSPIGWCRVGFRRGSRSRRRWRAWTPNELAPTSNNNGINGDPTLNYDGTAGLRPIKAKQADISIEWYYAPHDALTAAVLLNNINYYIYNAVSTSVDLGTLQYVGGPPGTVPGLRSCGR